MYKKTIKYVDFNGVEREEDFYFHLTNAELLKLEFGEKGGFEATIREISETEDAARVMDLFERIVSMSYGKRPGDGRNFIKRHDFVEEFVSSEAYSNMFMEMIENPDRMAEFVHGITSSVTADPNKKSFAAKIIEMQKSE